MTTKHAARYFPLATVTCAIFAHEDDMARHQPGSTEHNSAQMQLHFATDDALRINQFRAYFDIII